MTQTGNVLTIERKAELDWLRAGLVLLVFLHHIAMPFNGSEWHIVNEDSSEILDHIMVYFEQWRLPLLLLVSGAGTVLAFSKRTTWQFIVERSRRLLIPLLFGAFVIVPPQTYLQFIDRYNSYLDVYPEAITQAETNHLWFIEYLFTFSILAVPLILFLRSESSQRVKQLIEKFFTNPWRLLLWVLPLIAQRLLTQVLLSFEGDSISDMSKWLYYLYFFLAGIVLFSCKGLWTSLASHRSNYLLIASISFVLFYGYYFVPQEWLPMSLSIPLRWSIWWVVSCLAGWTTMLAIMAYAQVYLSKPKPWLANVTEAVYPFYILHQTVIVVLAYFIVQWNAAIPVKLISLLVLSFLCIGVLYVCVRSFKLSRFLFGMKPKQKEYLKPV